LIMLKAEQLVRRAYSIASGERAVSAWAQAKQFRATQGRNGLLRSSGFSQTTKG
jgi:hypothetical protein